MRSVLRRSLQGGLIAIRLIVRLDVRRDRWID
jgi:hypothetical protein